MKNLYTKSKGKIYPSPSSSSSHPSDVLSILNLLPSTILTLACVLGSDDKEVLAYLILRSIETPSLQEKKCKNPHKKPLLDCGCFNCYTSFWTRWDSSPNHDLIHQAIEAFEDHLTNTEKPKKNPTGKTKKKDRSLATGNSEKKKSSPEKETKKPEKENEEAKEEEKGGVEEVTGYWLEPVAPVQELPVGNNGGLVKDVMGLLNSRLWSLWNPNA
ncbi:uncharacterized protein LOC143891995 [Tasmannia lanceolata]|uniref:uncharacterized protein LOC143891995 n=1 Tax=Tasmannia lanceolata TaxID=3420 RepID=UPI0040630F0F